MIRITVYKPSGKYYTSETVEPPKDIIFSSNLWPLFIYNHLPAKVKGGYVVTSSDDNEEFFCEGLYLMDEILAVGDAHNNSDDLESKKIVTSIWNNTVIALTLNRSLRRESRYVVTHEEVKEMYDSLLALFKDSKTVLFPCDLDNYSDYDHEYFSQWKNADSSQICYIANFNTDLLVMRYIDILPNWVKSTLRRTGLL